MLAARAEGDLLIIHKACDRNEQPGLREGLRSGRGRGNGSRGYRRAGLGLINQISRQMVVSGVPDVSSKLYQA